MPGPVTHFIVPMLFVQILRDFFWKDKKFSFYYAFIAGAAGLAPDLDVIVYWMMYSSGLIFENVHRVFSHTLLVPLTFLVLAGVVIKMKDIKIRGERINLSIAFVMIAFGTATHLFLDWLLIGPIFPFSPFSMQLAGLNLAFMLPFSEKAILETIFPSLEGVMFLIWLAYQEYVHKFSRII